MSKIFISYRREDTKAIAGRIFDRLESRFGRHEVFFDVEGIPPGVDFYKFLDEQLDQSGVVVALVGPGWTGAPGNAEEAQICAKNDFVRLEIEGALQRNIPIIPVLIDGASFPNVNDLPESIRPLTLLNAIKLDVGQDFNVHMSRLIDNLIRYLIGLYTVPNPAHGQVVAVTPTGAIPVQYPKEVPNTNTIRTGLLDRLFGNERYLVRTFAGHEGGVLSVSFSPCGRYVLSSSRDMTIKMWDILTGEEFRTFKGHTDLVFSVAFSPDYATIASGSFDCTIKIWDISTGIDFWAFAEHPS